MTVAFKSERHVRLFDSVVTELREIGYRGDLIAPEYTYGDWFDNGKPKEVPAAAFAHYPPSYDNACFALLVSNGESGAPLVAKHRALGAPYALEVHEDYVTQWIVGQSVTTTLPQAEFGAADVRRVFAIHAEAWSPPEVLRSKGIGPVRWSNQLSLFYGLIPELESEIRKKLDPLLRIALHDAVSAYESATGQKPNDAHLYKLTFWALAGKVFHDRGIGEFRRINEATDPDAVLKMVAKHYGESLPDLLNRKAREAVHDRIWERISFRNLSVDILAELWSTTLVPDELRAAFGIHRTPRSVANYIVERIPFESIPEQERIVVEPCAGSAVFLVEAMHRLRALLDPQIDHQVRHEYFRRMLRGFEREPFGVEIGKFCLTLADLPSRDGWQVERADVFDSESFDRSLADARVVLCNPPFEDFGAERHRYGRRAVQKPVALLEHVLSLLHPDGLLGFVLPKRLLDGASYRRIRVALADRYREIEVVSLPDRAFDLAEPDSVLLIATSASKGPVTAITHKKITDDGLDRFMLYHEPSRTDTVVRPIEAVGDSLSVPQFGAVWTYLRRRKTLEDIADLHRGIEWNVPLTVDRKETGHRDWLIIDECAPDYMEGIPPRARPFWAFWCPPTKYLNVAPEFQRGNAYKRDWTAPKVFIVKARRSRGNWRIAACADTEGLTAYQTYTGIWPTDPRLVTWLAAVLNGPVANAYVATREGTRDIDIETLKSIPVPHVRSDDVVTIENAVNEYTVALRNNDFETADRLLRWIDSIVLDAYDLPPRMERELLDFFIGSERKVPFTFGPYFPADQTTFLSLREFLSGEFQAATAAQFRERMANPPGSFIDALNAALNRNPDS